MGQRLIPQSKAAVT